ncbi:polyprenyl synthetase family protein [Paenibacillus filicis]|uniref:Polyprenyl synthetase family protein n=1 Tax=Paenibacillus filicis TaxID=669464 RepID=A0ABU9DD98_9BACL
MNPEIKQQMERIVEEYIEVEDLKSLLISFIAEKHLESSSWSQVTLCTHYMLGGVSPDIQRLAAVTELIALTLDIIDDLQDQDQRSKPWMQCPQEVTLNAVLVLLMGAVGEMGQVGVSPGAMTEMSRIIARSVNGQQKDLNASVTNAEEYLAMTQERSGSLFRLACFMGYTSLAITDETIEHLHQLADCTGLIHQIQNDMRDLVRYDTKNDLIGRKRTLPLLYLLEVEDEAFRPIQDYYAGRLSADWLLANKDELIGMIHDSGCMEYARVVQSICLQKAEEIFAQVQGEDSWKAQLKATMIGSYLEAE